MVGQSSTPVEILRATQSYQAVCIGEPCEHAYIVAVLKLAAGRHACEVGYFAEVLQARGGLAFG